MKYTLKKKRKSGLVLMCHLLRFDLVCKQFSSNQRHLRSSFSHCPRHTAPGFSTSSSTVKEKDWHPFSLDLTWSPHAWRCSVSNICNSTNVKVSNPVCFHNEIYPALILFSNRIQSEIKIFSVKSLPLLGSFHHGAPCQEKIKLIQNLFCNPL